MPQLVVVGALDDDVEPADHHRQQIVEVVRDPAGQLAQRLHLLALPQLLLRVEQLLRALVDLAAEVELGLLGQRDVARHADEPDQFAVGPEARLRHAAQPPPLAVVALVTRLERERLAARLPGDALGDDPLEVVGMDPLAPVERPRLSGSQPGPQANSA